MIKVETSLPGLYIIEPQVFGDDRGFYESFHQDKFNDLGIKETFFQDNHSFSVKGVLRGLHYQLNPYAQGKLIRVVKGSVWNVDVDLRENSPTYLKWFAVELSADNKKMLYVPPGFANGFYSLSDEVDLLYKCTNKYSKEHSRSIKWDDPVFNIEWPILNEVDVILSDADKYGISYEEAKTELDFII